MIVNLVSPTQVKGWCIEHGFHPNKTLGQNFLIDGNVLTAIVDDAGIVPGSRVLEVGPGLGVLTRELLERGAHVTAVEKDARLCAWLRESLGADERFTLIEGDMLLCDLDALLADRFDTFVSNLPYSVGTRILLDVALHALAPNSFTVLVQQEVAERFVAPCGGAERGIAGVWLQRLYDVEILRRVKATCFWPRPEVASAVVQLRRHSHWSLAGQAEKRFMELTRLAFNHRRKQLVALYRRAWRDVGETAVEAWLAGSGVAPTARAAELTMDQWCALARTLSDYQQD